MFSLPKYTSSSMASQSLLQISDFLEHYKVVFVQNVPERLKCILCKEILKNAKQTSCGCKVCERCIREYLKEEEKPCPSKLAECCDTKLMLKRDIHQDNATNKEIGNLQIECPFKNCNTKDVIKNMVNHVDICEYREVSCDKCSKKYPLKEKIIHDKDDCDSRIVKCGFCKESMTALYNSTIHLNIDHEELCSKYVGVCPNDCGTKTVLLKEHLKKCTNLRIECPFSLLNCNVGKLNKGKMSGHLEEEAVPHLSSLVKEITELRKANDDLKEEVSRLSTLLKEQMEIIKKLTDSRMKIDKTIEEIKKRGPGVASAEKNVVFRNASFIWKIADFETLKSDAESGGRASVTSDPFYTSEFGYKMCLRIYPNGDGVGRGTHLSVFFAIMKGDFDDLLAWPFKQKVTLSLLDQENNGAKNHSDTFKPDARSACYQKPVDDCNIASGSPKFILLNSLIPTSIYYRNDTVFLKISVDTIGISKP